MAKPFNPVELAQQITVPCFFIYCENDDKIPNDAVQNIYEAVNGPKVIWKTDGRNHFDSYFYNPELYAHMARSFVELVLHGALDDLQELVVLRRG
jgi:predicted alpha/beta hydrolase